MKKSIQEFCNWVKAHPYTACLFSALTAALAAWDGTRPYLVVSDLWAWAILLAGVALVIYIDTSRLFRLLMVSLTIGSLLFQPKARAVERQPAAAGAIVAIVVVVVGGIIVFRVIRFCDRVFPRTPPAQNTNNPPEFAFGPAHSYAMATTCTTFGSCYTAPSLLAENNDPTVVELSGAIEETSQGTLAFRMQTTTKLNSTNDTVSLSEFERGMAEWGVRFGSAGEVFYGLDGQPSSPDLVPITAQLNGFNSAVNACDPAWEHLPVVFERSADLLHWEPILTVTVNVGQQISFSDATYEGQMFYRGRTVVGD
jgi:hypothetical protein